MANRKSPFVGGGKKRRKVRRKNSKRSGVSMAKRKRGRPRKAGSKRRKSAVASAPRRRRRRSLRSRARTAVRRTRRGAARIGRKIRRRGRRATRGISARGIVGSVKQAFIDGGFVVLGDVSANIAKILTGQTGIMGNVAQVGGGFVAGYVVSKYVSKDAGRMVMAGAVAGIVRQLVTDNVVPMLPAGAAKTNLTAALQGYPHSDYAAQMNSDLNGYVGAGQIPPNSMGLPSDSIYQGAF